MSVFLPVTDIEFPVVSGSHHPAWLGTCPENSLQVLSGSIIPVHGPVQTYSPRLAGRVEAFAIDFPADIHEHLVYPQGMQISSHQVT